MREAPDIDLKEFISDFFSFNLAKVCHAAAFVTLKHGGSIPMDILFRTLHDADKECAFQHGCGMFERMIDHADDNDIEILTQKHMAEAKLRPEWGILFTSTGVSGSLTLHDDFQFEALNELSHADERILDRITEAALA